MSRLKKWADRFKKEDRDLVEASKEEQFEKKDLPAMILAAMITIFPVVLVILALFALIMWFIFDFLLGLV